MGTIENLEVALEEEKNILALSPSHPRSPLHYHLLMYRLLSVIVLLVPRVPVQQT
jgi:hypothetical protein